MRGVNCEWIKTGRNSKPRRNHLDQAELKPRRGLAELVCPLPWPPSSLTAERTFQDSVSVAFGVEVGEKNSSSFVF